MPQDYGKILSKFGNKDLSQLNRPQRIFEKVTGYLVKQQEDEAIRDALQRVRRARASVSGLPFDASEEYDAMGTLATQGGERGQALIPYVAPLRQRADLSRSPYEDFSSGFTDKRQAAEDWQKLQNEPKPRSETGKKWVVRGGDPIFDFPQEGDLPYEKDTKEKPEGKQWVKTKDGKVLHRIPQVGDTPYDKPAKGGGSGGNAGGFPRTIPMVKPELDARGQHKTVTKTYKSKKEIEARLKSLDDLIKKSGVKYDKGGFGFLTPNVPVYSVWQEFTGGNATIEDLPEDFRAYASEYSQLQSNLEDVEGLTAGTEEEGTTTAKDNRKSKAKTLLEQGGYDSSDSAIETFLKNNPDFR